MAMYVILHFELWALMISARNGYLGQAQNVINTSLHIIRFQMMLIHHQNKGQSSVMLQNYILTDI